MSKLTIDEEIKLFEGLTRQMDDTFNNKRRSYGQTTTETYEKFGPVSMLIRMHDKMGRLDNLLGKGNKNLVPDEKVEDTLMDLAVYCIITIIEMQKNSDVCNVTYCSFPECKDELINKKKEGR